MDLENHPTTIVKMKSGYACVGDTQFLLGYCVLFSNPSVCSLNDLDLKARTNFLLDMSVIGDAVMKVCKPIRINYGILGNSNPNLHAHIFPRYSTEPENLQNKNVWQYPEKYWTEDVYKFNDFKHKELKNQLEQAIKDLMQRI